MSYSNTITSATTFTLTHAKYIASKVATDLARIQRFYDLPTNSQIHAYEELLSSEKNILAVIRADTLELKDKYGDERRTAIIDQEPGKVNYEDLIAEYFPPTLCW